MSQPGPVDAGRQLPAVLAADGCLASVPAQEPPRPRPRPRPRPTPAPRARTSSEELATVTAGAPAGVGDPVLAPDPLPTSAILDDGPLPAEDPAPELTEELTEELEEELEEELAVLEITGELPERGAVWELVRRAQAGDAEAFGEIYDQYVTMVHRYVYHRVGDRTTAEDVTSETFVRALRRIDSLTFQGRDVGAWLVTIARNIIRDHVKSSRYRLEVTTADMRDADHGTDGPEDAVVQQLTNEQLLACVKQLGGEQQECLALRFLQGLSVAETAAIMGKKDGAIKALQHRAVRRLAQLLPEGLR